MRGFSIRATLWVCLSLAVLVAIGGCSKRQATSTQEPTEQTPTDTTPPDQPPPADDGGTTDTGGSLEDVYFDYDRYEIRSDARSTLTENARILKDGSGSVVLEGHCDERGTDEYNLALGQRRADAVKAYLIDLGVNGSGLSTVSYGEERPAVDGHDESAWSRNRRVHFQVP